MLDDFARERVLDDFGFARELDFFGFAREAEPRLREELLDDFEEPALLLRRRLELRREAVLRSDAGISSVTTALVSDVIWPARNFAIRSSSRRMLRAS